jgi:CubicO group peptidase (beta-lactamase class C family)
MKKKYLTLLFICAFTCLSQSQDINKTILDSIVESCEKTNSNALVIYQSDELVYENYFDKPRVKIEAMSATKSIVSLAIGILLDKKYIDSIDQPVCTIYPEWKQGNKQSITIRHLLEHTSGIQNVRNAGIEVEVAPDIVQLALCAELEDMPGERFAYNNKACNLLAGIVETTSGLKLDQFLVKYLFSEMGITDVDWRTDEVGNPYAMAGLLIHPDDLAKIGLMVLHDGQWNGKQLISKDWMQKMQTPTRNNNNYGLQWWLTYETQYISFGDDFYRAIKELTDEETFILAQRMKGEYENMNVVREKVRSLYTKEELAVINGLMSGISTDLWQKGKGSIVSYCAEGYLGQHLIVVPEKDLVVVRMITAENYREVPNNSSMGNLKDLVDQL